MVHWAQLLLKHHDAREPSAPSSAPRQCAWRHRGRCKKFSPFRFFSHTSCPLLRAAADFRVTAHWSPLVWAAGFAVPVLVANVYFLEWQTFVLRADFLLNAISFVFVGLELLFSMFTAVSFYNHHRF